MVVVIFGETVGRLNCHVVTFGYEVRGVASLERREVMSSSSQGSETRWKGAG